MAIKNKKENVRPVAVVIVIVIFAGSTLVAVRTLLEVFKSKP